MIGAKKPGIPNARMNGPQTLDNMDLDRREEFAGDAFNPFGAQSSLGGINTQLQAQNAFMSKDTTEGGRLIDQLKPKKVTQREIKEELNNLEEV